MARHLLLVVLLYSVKETKVRALIPPKLTASPLVITETDSVTLNCRTPSSDPVSRCYFHVAKQKTSEVFSCVENLTGSELLQMAATRLPAEVKVRCSYSVMLGAIPLTSPDSDPSTIIINNLLPPKLTVAPLLITETDLVTLSCQTPSSVPVSQCYFSIVKTSATTFPCLTTLTGSQLLSLTRQSSPATVEVACFYLESHPSPKSTMSPITIQPPRPELTVNPPVITETDRVTLDCVTPPSVSVLGCYLYSMRTKASRSISCRETLTGAALLSMADESPPAEVEVTCYYTKEHRGGQYQSPRSTISSISIQMKPTSGDTITSSTVQPTGDPATEWSTKAAGLPVTPLKQAPDLWTAPWMVVIAPGVGVIVGVIILGVALVCNRRRRGGDEELNRRSNSVLYHVYSTIPEEPAAASEPTSMQYYSVQPH